MYIAQKIDSVDRALWSPFLNFSKFDVLRFQKILKKILAVYSNVFYSTAKYQNEMVCISPCTKKTNSEQSEEFRFFTVHHLRSGNLSFLRILNYAIIRVDFFAHICRFHRYLHLRFFSDFFKTSNY
jgi:hypothetical protein